MQDLDRHFISTFFDLEYFRCSQAGTFADTYNCAQGSYFLCDYSSKSLDLFSFVGILFFCFRSSYSWSMSQRTSIQSEYNVL